MEVDTVHHLLLVAFCRSNHAMTSRTRKIGLMPGQPKILEYVADHEGCLQRDIAQACAMDRATFTGTLGRMEEAGLISRKPKANDKRALEVWLTDKGWAAAEHVALCDHEVDEVAYTGMTAAERSDLSHLLARVIENFEKAEEKNAHE